MPRGMATLAAFDCFGCEKRLGWTSPSEAGRINIRAHVFCEDCKDAPASLTDRQQELVDTLTAQKSRGERPTLSKAAQEMKVSRSRVQQIKDAILARGEGNPIDALLHGSKDLPTTTNPTPVVVTPAAAVETVGTPAETEWEYRVPEYTVPNGSGIHDSDSDPAVFGGEFVV